jgi:hypothetical protein
MIMWQEIAVILIGCATAGYLIYKIIRLITVAVGKRRHNPCDGCCGCSLKNKE